MPNVTFLSKVDINIQHLREGFAPRQVVSARNRAELIAAMPETDVLIVQNQGFPRKLVDDEVLAVALRLRLIQHHGVTCDTTDVAAAARRGIPVATIPGQNSQSVAEHALFLLMALVRRAHLGQALLRAGRMGELECVELQGKTLCIVGLGTIGQSIARMASGFGMQVIAVRRSGPSREPLPQGVSAILATADMGNAFHRSDFIVLALPLNSETFHLIDASAVGAMRPGTFLVNISRGDHVERAALETALRDGIIQGYGADAWWTEPANPQDPLIGDERVLVTPHMGGKSVEAIRRSVAAVRQNVERLERGEALRGVVDPVRAVA
jgi:phosphoglycerate dehydrogenase-like enzyme